MGAWTRRWQRTGVLSLEALEDRSLLSTGFTQINLDSDTPGIARVTDPNLVNPWGIAFSPTGGFWFGDNGTSVSDVVDGNGQLLPVVVRVPGADGNSGTPTGTVYNAGSGFQVTENGVSGPAAFLFASQDGTISAWNPQVDFAHAIMRIDNSKQGASYMGLAMADGTDGQSHLYAADFGRGEIDVFDQNFNELATTGSFTDPNIPTGFAPFNVQNINGQLFVAYAKKATGGNNDAPGPGNGFIDVFNPSGNLIERLASGGSLNSPWGMAIAPQSFGSLGGALLVGNNGDGRISAFDLSNGAYLGQLADNAGNPITIDGLWGLTVGNDHLAGNSQTVFFAAGIDHEQHGLFGAIQNSQAGQSSTSGTLPYDPNSDGDDYPLPPANGPTLSSDFAQSTPSSVLLPASSSSFALAPTLSIPSEPSENRTVYSFVPARSSTVLGGTQDPNNLGIAIGSMPWPGGLSAFSLTSPMKPISPDRPGDRIISHLEGKEADYFPTTSLLYLDQYPWADFVEPEDPYLLVSNRLSPSQRPADAQVEMKKIITDDCSPKDLESGWSLNQIGASSEEGDHPQTTVLPCSLVQQPMAFADPAATGVMDWPTTPFHAYLIRGVFITVAACLPWGHFGVSKWRGRNHVSLHGWKDKTS